MIVRLTDWRNSITWLCAFLHIWWAIVLFSNTIPTQLSPAYFLYSTGWPMTWATALLVGGAIGIAALWQQRLLHVAMLLPQQVLLLTICGMQHLFYYARTGDALSFFVMPAIDAITIFHTIFIIIVARNQVHSE